MPLQNSGPISLEDIALEYSGERPHALSLYSEHLEKTQGQTIAISEFYGRSANTIVLLDKSYDVYTYRQSTIPIANILAGSFDEYSDGQAAIRLVAVSNAQFGTVKIEGVNVVFTSSSDADSAARFDYVVENSIGVRKTHFVTMNVVVIPPLICNPDTFSLQQSESLFISASELIANDEDSSGSGITLQAVNAAVGGHVSLSGNTITFVSTGLAEQPAEFKYQVKNGLNQQQTGTVFINVTPLPELEAFVYRTQSEVSSTIASYSPPTMEDVFNSWGRFAGAAYFPDASSATGEAADWQFLRSPDRVSMPTNTGAGCGFISLDKLDNFSFEATLTSPDSDDDTIGLIVAFVREGSVNKFLALVRTKGGMGPNQGYGLIYSENGPWPPTWVINDINIDGVAGGFSGAQTRVKIQRQGDVITCYTTNWNDVNNYQAASKITVDLNSDSRLNVFKGAQQYGYYTHSQAGSTYLDIEFNGGLDTSKIYDMQNNQCWEYSDNRWQVVPGTIQSHLGYIRKVFNPETLERYLISSGSVTRLGRLVDNAQWQDEKLLDQRQYTLGDQNLGQNGAGVGARVLGLYAQGTEERNALIGKPTLLTTSAHSHNVNTPGANNLGTQDWFADKGIDLIGTNYVGGTVVIEGGIVGRITAIGNNNGTSAYVHYQVVSYRLFDLTA
ncbi:hypothetical protein BGP78_01635 [Pseudoalteromonas sp. MSK9-3]|uniref:Ig-like domain-containing protein n=1 Tax=Pseudoalteromonas sp. MSK9-3 TaxID=1897633 RepID=UPI000E6BCE39|nr:Ig-like domain-containing protein [Pseudoalteromonas sp. MSK9-3]RJE76975.1 hypothetical protein BGP78_01635 [Pseudoalteromonas sp. MSK9-3]